MANLASRCQLFERLLQLTEISRGFDLPRRATFIPVALSQPSCVGAEAASQWITWHSRTMPIHLGEHTPHTLGTTGFGAVHAGF